MPVFQTKTFARFARRERIARGSLLDAIAQADRGLVDADLGGGVIKQRVAREGGGRSGGYRMLIAFKAAKRAVFLFGFAKNDQDNIDDDELELIRAIAKSWLEADATQIRGAIADGLLIEVDL